MEAIETQIRGRDWSQASDAEFLALQEAARRRLEETPPGAPAIRGWELIEGRLWPMSPVDVSQSRVTFRLILILGAHVERIPGAELLPDVLTYLDAAGASRVYPDLVYLGPDSRARIVGRHVEGPATLIVEVTVPEGLERDTLTKKAAYHRAGVEWYWIVNLVSGAVEEYRWAEQAYELVSQSPLTEPFRPALFPGMEIEWPVD